MAISQYDETKCWTYLDGKWLQGNPPLMGPWSDASWLGSAIFDGSRAFEGVTPDLELHCQRCERSALAFGLKPLKAGAIEELVRDGIEKFPKNTPLYLRPMFWAETNFLDPGPMETRYCISVYESAMPSIKGFSAGLSTFRRPSYECAPTDAKAACHYANSGRAVREGSEAAVRILVARHNQRLFRVARAILRDDAEAEDVVQETYFKAFTKLGSFRGDALLSTWLTRIALNETVARVRRRRPTADLADIDAGKGSVVMFPTKSPVSPEAEAGRSQVRALLERAVDELPEPFRIVFIMREIEEMSTEETASHLSLKIETVKTRLHRARKLMRATIEQRLAAAFSELYPFKGKRCASMADRVVQDLRERQ